MEAFILILMIAGAGITIAAVKSAGGNADAAWKAASQRLGLRFEHTDISSSPVITGARRGLSVRIDTHAKSGENSRQYTRYRVSFKESLGLGLRLTSQGPIARVAKKLGTQDILTGDEDFDGAVVVKGRDPQKVIEFLTPVRKLRAVRFLTLAPGSIIDDVSIESETRDVERSPDRIVRMVQRMTSLAEHLTTDDDADPDYLEAMTSSGETEPDPHFIGLPYVPGPGPISLEDMLVVESAPAEAPESPRSFSEAIDEEILPEVELQDHNEDIPEESKTAAPSSSDDESLSIEAVAQTLFAQHQTTSEATELFESMFKGQDVAWAGTLLNIRTYRFDLVFGDVPGTRAELKLLGPDDPSTAGRPIKAVVQCPIELEDNLRNLVDRRVAFRGVLLSCDAFMKTLFVVDGQIDEVHA